MNNAIDISNLIKKEEGDSKANGSAPHYNI
jgi:hypothetical protein